MAPNRDETLVLISEPWLSNLTKDPRTGSTIRVDVSALAHYCVDHWRSTGKVTLSGRVHINYYYPGLPKLPEGSSQADIDDIKERKRGMNDFEYRLDNLRIRRRQSRVSFKTCPACKTKSESAKEINTLIACDVADEIIYNTSVANFVIISGDGDIVPILKFIHKHDRRVLSVVSNTATAGPLYSLNGWDGLKISWDDLEKLPRI